MTYHHATQLAAVSNPAIVFDRPALTDAVVKICDVVERRNTIPVLSNLRIIGHGARAQIIGTDLDMEIAVSIPAGADSRFDTTIPAHLLKELLKKAAKTDSVTMAQDNEGQAVAADTGKTKYNLQAIDASDFPEMIARKWDSHFTLTGEDVFELLDCTLPNVSTEETRYYLNGVYFHADQHNGELVAVATDGHRLGRKRLDVPTKAVSLNFAPEIWQRFAAAFKPEPGAESMPAVIIPQKAVKIVHKLLKGRNKPEAVDVYVNESKIRFSFDGVTVTTKVIDGTFPDYTRVIPMHNDHGAIIDKADLAGAIKDVALISSDKGRAVKFEFGGNSCTLGVSNPDSGNAETTIPCRGNFDFVETGGGLTTGFNHSYIAGMLAQFGDGEIAFELQDTGSPARITGDRPGFDFVLMPMRV